MDSLELFITHDNIFYEVSAVCESEIVLTTKRWSASKLTFKIIRNSITGTNINFSEGDNIRLIVNKVPMFNGFIFSKSRNKEHIITVTAYDQLRYLKNKDTYCYSNKTAAEVIKLIADDFFLSVGELEDTVYKIENRVEDGQTLMDIICNAIDLTSIYTGRLFIFYDNFGKLMLKDMENLRLPLMIVSDTSTLINFDYKTDIDTDTYNKIKLYIDSDETKTRQMYIAQDSQNQNKYGILQHYQKVSNSYDYTKISEMAEQLLLLKNRPKCTLTVEDIGDVRVHAGCSILVNISDLGDRGINNWLLVESCTHTFKNNEHTMKIELNEWSVRHGGN